MSTFVCKQCGMMLVETKCGYINGCDHHKQTVADKDLSRRERTLARSVRIRWERDNLEAMAWDKD